MRALPIAAGLVLGCGATPADPPGTFVVPPRCDVEKPAPPPPYAAMFEVGAVTRFEISYSDDFAGSLDATLWHGSARDWMRCTVRAVEPHLGPTLATVTTLECDDNDCDACSAPEWFGVGLGRSPGGRYVATAAGLWEAPYPLYEDDAEVQTIVAALDPARVLVDAVPRPRGPTVVKQKWQVDSYEISRAVDGSWCRTHVEGGYGDIRCFGPGGLVAGASWEGSRAVRFSRAR